MSNFSSTAINPATLKREPADYLDDYFGRHKYGVRFCDGRVYPVAKVDELALAEHRKK